jgi:hypothetical protein
MGKIYSKLHSVFYDFDMIYYQAWIPMFTPLDQEDVETFLAMVSSEEEKKERMLTRDEVEEIMDGYIRF